MKAEQTHLSISPVSLPFSTHLAHSPIVLKKDIFVPWGLTILTSRDELLIEKRGQRDSLHAAGYPTRPHAALAFRHVCGGMIKRIFILAQVDVYWIFVHMSAGPTHVLRNAKDVGSPLLRATWALALASCASSFVGKLMWHCFVLQPYNICTHNETAFCPDWTGWWHRYEIVLAFPCLPPHNFLPSGLFDLYWFALIWTY